MNVKYFVSGQDVEDVGIRLTMRRNLRQTQHSRSFPRFTYSVVETKIANELLIQHLVG